jgi:hypothetical protein
MQNKEARGGGNETKRGLFGKDHREDGKNTFRTVMGSCSSSGAEAVAQPCNGCTLASADPRVPRVRTGFPDFRSGAWLRPGFLVSLSVNHSLFVIKPVLQLVCDYGSEGYCAHFFRPTPRYLPFRHDLKQQLDVDTFAILRLIQKDTLVRLHIRNAHADWAEYHAVCRVVGRAMIDPNVCELELVFRKGRMDLAASYEFTDWPIVPCTCVAPLCRCEQPPMSYCSCGLDFMKNPQLSSKLTSLSSPAQPMISPIWHIDDCKVYRVDARNRFVRTETDLDVDADEKKESEVGSKWRVRSLHLTNSWEVQLVYNKREYAHLRLVCETMALHFPLSPSTAAAWLTDTLQNKGSWVNFHKDLDILFAGDNLRNYQKRFSNQPNYEKAGTLGF